MGALNTCINTTAKPDLLCFDCKQYLLNLTSTYSDATHGCQQTVDAIDAYRRGLSIWSSHNCPTPVPGKQPVLIILVLVLVWLVLFYILSRVFTKMPAQFFFGTVDSAERRSIVEHRLEDAPDIPSQYFERTGPGLRGECAEFEDPVSPSMSDALSTSLADVLKTRRRTNTNTNININSTETSPSGAHRKGAGTYE